MMLLKPGVDISKLEKPIRTTLGILDDLLPDHEGIFVVTSTYEGDHIPNSLHYAHRAYDFVILRGDSEEIIERFRKAVGKDYDILVDVNHYHIEYDPEGR